MAISPDAAAAVAATRYFRMWFPPTIPVTGTSDSAIRR